MNQLKECCTVQIAFARENVRNTVNILVLYVIFIQALYGSPVLDDSFFFNLQTTFVTVAIKKLR